VQLAIVIEAHNMDLISVSSGTIINDRFLTHNSQILQMLSNVSDNETFINFVDRFSTNGADPELYQSSFVSIVTETVFDYPHNSYGEKTWKPIINLRPFIIVGPPGSIDQLKAFGFKTFSAWWSEDYDNLIDPVDRIKSIVDIVEYIANLNHNKIISIFNEMKPILAHNRDHYFNNFKISALSDFRSACKQNLNPR
jgi:hypothetical protein